MAAGKEYQYKQAIIVTPDLRGFTVKAEISTDGETWTPWFEEKGTKAKSAPKK